MRFIFSKQLFVRDTFVAQLQKYVVSRPGGEATIFCTLYIIIVYCHKYHITYDSDIFLRIRLFYQINSCKRFVAIDYLDESHFYIYYTLAVVNHRL